MTEVLSVQYKQTGFPGAPGWTTLCFSPIVVIPDLDKFNAASEFIQACSGFFPTAEGWNATLQAPCDIQDVATGALLGQWPGPGGADVHPGGAAGGYGAGVAGACVSWYTASNGNGRPPRGRTFLVPLAASAYDTNGTLTTAAQTTLQTAAQTLIDSGTGFGIWHRPKLKVGGEFFTAITARVSDQAAFLSSRRS